MSSRTGTWLARLLIILMFAGWLPHSEWLTISHLVPPASMYSGGAPSGWVHYPGWLNEWYSDLPEKYAFPASLSSPHDPHWGFWFW